MYLGVILENLQSSSYIKKASHKYLLSLLIILTLFTLSSCDYTPTGANYVNVNNTPPTGYINLNFALDTIDVWGQTYFSYKIDIGNRQAQSVNLYVDDQLIYSGFNLIDSVFFNSLKYSSDSHTLEIKVIANSGTGSIADNFGAEKAIYSKKWTLIIDNNQPVPVQILSVKPDNGRLKIEWNKYNNFNFQFYRVYKDNYLVTTYYDRNITSWIDTVFVCGSDSYRIDVGAAFSVSEGNTFNYTGNFSNIIYLTVTDSNKVKIIWTKNVFYNNFGGYSIYRGSPGNESLIYSVKDINDTSFVDDNPYFGSEISYKVGVFSNADNGYGTFSGTGMTCTIGTKMISANSFQYVPTNNSIYIENNTGIYRMDAQNHTILASQSFTPNSLAQNYLSVSAGGLYAYLSDGNNFLQLNPLTLSVVKTIDLNSIMGYNSYSGLNFAVTDSNYIAYTSCVPLQFQNAIYLVDNVILNMNNNSIVDSVVRSQSNWNPAMSGNNKYFYTYGVLYGLNNNKLFRKGTASAIQFIGSGDEYIESGSNSIQIKRSIDMSLITTINISNAGSYTYDPSTGYLGVTENINNNYYYLIYDPNTGAEIKRVLVASSYNYFLANSTLYSYNGYYLPLNLK